MALSGSEAEGIISGTAAWPVLQYLLPGCFLVLPRVSREWGSLSLRVASSPFCRNAFLEDVVMPNNAHSRTQKDRAGPGGEGEANQYSSVGIAAASPWVLDQCLMYRS